MFMWYMCRMPVLTLVFTSIVACVNTPSIPEDHFYRLPDIVSVDTIELSGVESIGVAQVKAEGLYRERSLLYLFETNPLELKPYHYRYWTLPPAELIQEHMIRFLRTALPGKKVQRYSAGDAVDAVINTRILRFERVIHDNSASVIINLEFSFYQNGQTVMNKLFQREYRLQSEQSQNEINQSVMQYGSTLINIYRTFLNDLKANNK